MVLALLIRGCATPDSGLDAGLLDDAELQGHDADAAEPQDAAAAPGEDDAASDDLPVDATADEVAPCPTGAVTGVACPPGGSAGPLRVFIDSRDCDGSSVHVADDASPGGPSLLSGVPAGSQVLRAEAGAWSSEATVRVTAGSVVQAGELGDCEPEPGCRLGHLAGALCPPGGETSQAAGIPVGALATGCDGEPAEVWAMTSPGAGFALYGVPAGIAQLRVEPPGGLPWIAAVEVQPDQVTDLGPIGAIGCSGLPPLPPPALCDDPKLAGCEACNYLNDDGDGITDEECPAPPGDGCNYADDDCDGLVDEDCPAASAPDDCDGTDTDCDGIPDDCPPVGPCVDPMDDFADCDGNGLPDVCPRFGDTRSHHALAPEQHDGGPGVHPTASWTHPPRHRLDWVEDHGRWRVAPPQATSCGLPCGPDSPLLRLAHKRSTSNKRRAWRKLHLGVDSQGFIVASELTGSGVDDPSVGVAMLEGIEADIGRFTADGAYDTRAIYAALQETGGTRPHCRDPPPKTASLSKPREELLEQRDAAIARMAEVGRRQWRQEAGAYQQACAENGMYPYKRLIGDAPRSRKPAAQKREAMVAVKVINRMTALGMPESVAVTR